MSTYRWFVHDGFHIPVHQQSTAPIALRVPTCQVQNLLAHQIVEPEALVVRDLGLLFEQHALESHARNARQKRRHTVNLLRVKILGAADVDKPKFYLPTLQLRDK